MPNLPAPNEHEIIASGGGLLRSPAWLQIFADVLGAPVHTLGEEEATSRGIALLALEQLGVIDSPSDLPPVTGDAYEPDPERHDLYRMAMDRQADLYSTLLE